MPTKKAERIFTCELIGPVINKKTKSINSLNIVENDASANSSPIISKILATVSMVAADKILVYKLSNLKIAIKPKIMKNHEETIPIATIKVIFHLPLS
jgi:hypothetical protein